MSRDLEKMLEEATDALIKQQNAASLKAEKDAHAEANRETLRTQALNKLYEEKFLPHEAVYVERHIPKSLIEFFETFREKLEQKMGYTFEQKRNVFWGTEASWFDINHDEKDKTMKIEAMNSGVKPDIRIEYAPPGTHNTSGCIHFGITYSQEQGLSWFQGAERTDKLSDSDEDLQKMINSFAEVLTSQDPKKLLTGPSNSSSVDWGDWSMGGPN